MTRSLQALVVLFIFYSTAVRTQVASDCANAIPICNNIPVNGGTQGYGLDDFNGAAVSGCLEQSTSGAIESNAAWYRFRTAQAGQLGFSITHDTAEDWDFALYQTSDCSNLGTPVRCNFFDNRDENHSIGVGIDPTGNTENVQYEAWLEVSPGQDFYLLINNFSANNSGFSIQFTGQLFIDHPYTALDCTIINNLLGPPRLACENELLILDATTAGALDYSWFVDNGSGYQELVGEKDATLQVSGDGQYRVRVTTAVESVVSETQIAFASAPVAQPLEDEVFCIDGDTVFNLQEKDAQTLGNQSESEFVVTYHRSSTDAITGNDPLPKQYEPISSQETIYVRLTSLQNANCYDATQEFELVSISDPFSVLTDAVQICDGENALLGSTDLDPNFEYIWDTGEQTSQIIVQEAGIYNVTASHRSYPNHCFFVKNIEVISSLPPVISSIDIDDFQTLNTVTINTEGTGSYEYQLDEGAFQDSAIFREVLPGAHTLTLRDKNGCGSITEEIVVMGFFNHFSPNGDALNEQWHVPDLSLLTNPEISIYDRYGKYITQLTEQSNGWDGTYKGQPMPPSDYWFKLTYTDASGNRVVAKYIQNHFSLRR